MTSDSRKLSRRDALKGLVAGASLATLPAATVACKPGDDKDGLLDSDLDSDTLDSDASPINEFQTQEGLAASKKIKTVVVLMMENRSFDHYFGSLTIDEGRTDVEGLRADITNDDVDGTPVSVSHLTIECMVDPDHSWGGSHSQFNNGKNDGFVKSYAKRDASGAAEIMGYYTREDLPVYYKLLDGGSLCDQWFCSVMGPTWPNRFYSMCGTSLGNDRTSDFSFVPFKAPSIFGQCERAGLSWHAYNHDLPFTALLEDRDQTKIYPIDRFFDDAAAGTLPHFVWLEPAYSSNDDHPPHPMLLGQVLVGTIYAALANSPQWEECAFIIDYDEHGGFHDHVAPPKTEDDLADQGFDQLGFRIPALVLGPWAKTGVCHTVYDHTSVLKTLQEMHGLESLTKRNAAAKPLWDCFDFERMKNGSPADPVTLPTLDVDPSDFGTECFGLIVPNQPDLWEAADRGLIPRELDLRDQISETMDRLLARAAKFGVIRFVHRGHEGDL